jgi:hypothetical protein
MFYCAVLLRRRGRGRARSGANTERRKLIIHPILGRLSKNSSKFFALAFVQCHDNNMLIIVEYTRAKRIYISASISS